MLGKSFTAFKESSNLAIDRPMMLGNIYLVSQLLVCKHLLQCAFSLYCATLVLLSSCHYGLGIRIQTQFALVHVTRWLIKRHDLSYTTVSWYAGSCMQWGVWVWTIGLGYPGSGNVLFQRQRVHLKKRIKNMSERRSWVTDIVVSPNFLWSAHLY